eukprot:6201280-Pleurochrysis_carterae.AAC.2
MAEARHVMRFRCRCCMSINKIISVQVVANGPIGVQLQGRRSEERSAPLHEYTSTDISVEHHEAQNHSDSCGMEVRNTVLPY